MTAQHINGRLLVRKIGLSPGTKEQPPSRRVTAARGEAVELALGFQLLYAIIDWS
jgi:hypothetical protein